MKLPPPPMPALLNSTSMTLPWAATTSSRNAMTFASSDTSQTWVVTFVPAGAPDSARTCVSASPDGFTSHVATEHPAAANWTASSLPIPDAPPVTTARFPPKDSMVDSDRYRGPYPGAGVARAGLVGCPWPVLIRDYRKRGTTTYRAAPNRASASVVGVRHGWPPRWPTRMRRTGLSSEKSTCQKQGGSRDRPGRPRDPLKEGLGV